MDSSRGGPQASGARKVVNPSSSLSLIHKLPNELLGLIFLHGCRFPIPYDGENEPDAPRNPLRYQRRISSVCAKWRTLALGTQHLWSYIWIPLEHRHALQLLHMYAERASTATLAIVVQGHILEEEVLSSLRSPLHKLFRRAYFLYIEFSWMGPENSLPALFPLPPLPCMEHLALELPHTSTDRLVSDLCPVQTFTYAVEGAEHSPTAEEIGLVTKASPGIFTWCAQRFNSKYTTFLGNLGCLQKLQLAYMSLDSTPGSKPFSHSTLTHLMIYTPNLNLDEVLGDFPALKHLALRVPCLGTEKRTIRNRTVPLERQWTRRNTRYPSLLSFSAGAGYGNPYCNHTELEIASVVHRVPHIHALELWDETAVFCIEQILDDAIKNRNAYANLRLVRIVLNTRDEYVKVDVLSGHAKRLMKLRPNVVMEWYDRRPKIERYLELGLPTGLVEKILDGFELPFPALSSVKLDEVKGI